MNLLCATRLQDSLGYRLVGGGGGASAHGAARCGASPRRLGRAEDRVDGRERVLEDQPQPLDRRRQERGDVRGPGIRTSAPRRTPTATPGALTRCRRSCRPGWRRPQARRGSTRCRSPAARRGRGWEEGEEVRRRASVAVDESASQPRRGWTHDVDLLELASGGGVRHGGGDEREREGELEGLHGGGCVCVLGLRGLGAGEERGGGGVRARSGTSQGPLVPGTGHGLHLAAPPRGGLRRARARARAAGAGRGARTRGPGRDRAPAARHCPHARPNAPRSEGGNPPPRARPRASAAGARAAARARGRAGPASPVDDDASAAPPPRARRPAGAPRVATVHASTGEAGSSRRTC